MKRGSGRLIFPVNGPITSPFGPRWGRLHAGIGIPAPDGNPIRAADSGTVALLDGVGASGGYGNYACVQHTTSMSTCYAHQSRLGTSLGASVTQRQVIGYVGNTGHSFGALLHFEVRINGTPVDPMGYLQTTATSARSPSSCRIDCSTRRVITRTPRAASVADAL